MTRDKDGVAFTELRNKTDLTFEDISSETQRTYVFVVDGYQCEVTIEEPEMLNVSKNGHRVIDGEGTCHYIPKGWIQLSWNVEEGAPHFVK